MNKVTTNKLVRPSEVIRQLNDNSDKMGLVILEAPANLTEYISGRFINFEEGDRLAIDTLQDGIMVKYVEDSQLMMFKYDPLTFDGNFINQYRLLSMNYYERAHQLRDVINQELFVAKGDIDESGDVLLPDEEDEELTADERLIDITGDPVYVIDNKD